MLDEQRHICRRCDHCGEKYQPPRHRNLGAAQKHARFCSPGCRVAAHRKRAKCLDNRARNAVTHAAPTQTAIAVTTRLDAQGKPILRPRGNPPTSWYCGLHWHACERTARRCREEAA
jgi:hypothetical protein